MSFNINSIINNKELKVVEIYLMYIIIINIQ